MLLPSFCNARQVAILEIEAQWNLDIQEIEKSAVKARVTEGQVMLDHGYLHPSTSMPGNASQEEGGWTGGGEKACMIAIAVVG